MNPMMLAWFDALTEAVAIVDVEAVVHYCNPPAGALFDVEPGVRLPLPAVAAALADLARSADQGPRTIAIQPPVAAEPAYPAVVAALPLPDRYVVSAANLAERKFFDTTLRNFHEYLRQELAEPIRSFTRRLDAAAGSGSGLDPLIADGKLIADRLARVEQLAGLFGTAVLIDQERIAFPEMIAQALQSVAEILSRRGIEVYLDGLERDLPPVYGSRRWLDRAMNELVTNAAKHAVAKSKLEIALRCTGTHVIVSLRNHGLFGGNQLKSRRLFVPFNKPVEPGGARKPAAEPAAAKGPGLGLPMIQQIVRLHGGALVIDEDEDNNTVEFNLELATGAPARDQQALDIQQAQRYAHDMATLVGRMKSGKTRPAAGTT